MAVVAKGPDATINPAAIHTTAAIRVATIRLATRINSAPFSTLQYSLLL